MPTRTNRNFNLHNSRRRSLRTRVPFLRFRSSTAQPIIRKRRDLKLQLLRIKNPAVMAKKIQHSRFPSIGRPRCESPGKASRTSWDRPARRRKKIPATRLWKV
uniref:(northern house mosquito) hypothetical protein n=1 Tax=Culex pipiens TaxID=7175 RepID=A0A8D8KS54_CULPI